MCVWLCGCAQLGFVEEGSVKGVLSDDNIQIIKDKIGQSGSGASADRYYKLCYR